jgi:hypothetical protein
MTDRRSTVVHVAMRIHRTPMFDRRSTVVHAAIRLRRATMTDRRSTIVHCNDDASSPPQTLRVCIAPA